MVHTLCNVKAKVGGMSSAIYCIFKLPREEKPHSPIILPNGEYHENPTLTVRFASLENVQ